MDTSRRNLLGAGVALVLGIGGVGVARLWRDSSEHNKVLSTSDSSRIKGTIKIGIDNFAGYFYLASPHLRMLMRQGGYELVCEDDKGDYAKRMQRLTSDKPEDKLDLAVATVDSYLLNGSRQNFPGTIVATLDVSKGADALVARADVVKNIDDLRMQKDLKIAFTKESPSEYLLKHIGADFGIPWLLDVKGSWRRETDSSVNALKLLLAGEVQVAVIWEPDVSKALAKPGFVKILGTENTDRFIVDILIASRRFVQGSQEVLTMLLANYFRTLKHYRDSPAELVAEIARYLDLDPSGVPPILRGIAMVGLSDNAVSWFGAAESGRAPSYGLIETIQATDRVLVSTHQVQKSTLPGGDASSIVFSRPLVELYQNGLQIPSEQVQAHQSLDREFPALDDTGWRSLKVIGTLKVRPIRFQRSTSSLTLDDKEQIDQAVETIRNYPEFRILVKGHTNPHGLRDANRVLSQERADTVAQYLRATYDVNEHRIRAVGLGSDEPLIKQNDESDRSYADRLSRVELALLADVY